jgi:hypothetical protein
MESHHLWGPGLFNPLTLPPLSQQPHTQYSLPLSSLWLTRLDTKCPAFLATQNDDDARKKTACFYREMFGFNFEIEYTNCEECRSFRGSSIPCYLTCEIRRCCRQKGLENCGARDEQPCQNLNRFHEFSPDAKACFNELITQQGS